tara:strand:+ start:239 stop:628 length:390 start_codon:yes stop_codon:yes gene_type:complete
MSAKNSKKCTVALHPSCGFCEKLKAEIRDSSLVADGTCVLVNCAETPDHEACGVTAFPHTHLGGAAPDIQGYVPDWEARVGDAVKPEDGGKLKKAKASVLVCVGLAVFTVVIILVILNIFALVPTPWSV